MTHPRAQSESLESPAFTWIPFKCGEYRLSHFIKAPSHHKTWGTTLLVFPLALLFQHPVFTLQLSWSNLIPNGNDWHYHPMSPLFSLSTVSWEMHFLLQIQNWDGLDWGRRRKTVIVNSPNSHNFHSLNILSGMNHFICCRHILPSLISQFRLY